MAKMKKLGFLCIFLAIFSSDVSAAVLRCDHCGEPGYSTKASAAGLGIHYVYDLPQAKIRKYQVSLECNDNLDDGKTSCVKQAFSLPVEAEVDAFLLELAAYYGVTRGTMSSNFTVDAGGTAGNLSAFDVAGPGGPRNQLITWFHSSQAPTINNTLPLLGAAIHQVSVTVTSLWNDSMGKTFVTVQFGDGSEVTLSYEMINGTTEVVPGSAKDKFGNVIPATADELNGLRFDYSSEGPGGPAQRRMMDYLSIFGATMPASTSKWTCIRIGDEKWNCVRI
jgi:hypothetical protein